MLNAANINSDVSCQEMLDDWKPISSAPYGKVLEVRNEQMGDPCLATRGYTYNGAVHQNQKFFTTVYTPDRFFPTPAGQLCCPTEWRYRDGHDGAL